MKKVTKLVLMLGLVFSGALCYAHGMDRKGDGINIEIIDSGNCTDPSRGNAIIPTLNDHVLSVVFSENLGQVSVKVATTSGATVECLSVLTPNGLQVYIPNSGNYIVTFTLSNGDEYYGEFTVTD